jgi:hypothetical protein
MKWPHFAHTTIFIFSSIALCSTLFNLSPYSQIVMYIPSITTKIHVHQFDGKGAVNTPQGRRIGTLVGLGIVGVLAAGKLMPSKKQTVVWGIGGELDKANGEADVLRGGGEVILG